MQRHQVTIRSLLGPGGRLDLSQARILGGCHFLFRGSSWQGWNLRLLLSPADSLTAVTWEAPKAPAEIKFQYCSGTTNQTEGHYEVKWHFKTLQLHGGKEYIDYEKSLVVVPRFILRQQLFYHCCALPIPEKVPGMPKAPKITIWNLQL